VLKKISELLQSKEFISVATSSLSGKPNAAPKFFLKVEGNFVYLIDYTRGKTWENLRINPHVSLSFMDTDALIGYQINGSVELIEKGPTYEKISSELTTKEIDLSTKRIIEGVSQGKKHKSFEVGLSDKVIIIKVAIKEIAGIGPDGEIKREILAG
jgi:predicted pyridoxine 5'-phosphate oxidase superfamily flavin-nucleotide-binding protein